MADEPILTLDENHHYALGEDKLVSVTQVIHGEGLSGDTSHWNDAAMNRGSFVHAACEYHDLGTLDEETLDPALAPYLTAYKAFKAHQDPHWLVVEGMRCDLTLRYAGTIDRAGRIKASKFPVVLDIKSGSPAKWHGIQLAAYKRLVAKDLPEGVIWRYALYLSDDGTYKLEKLSLDDSEDWEVFRCALTLANWKRRHCGNNR
jgi:hypothetical protein